jgi:hypothetical protein
MALALRVFADVLVSELALADCEYCEGHGESDGVSGEVPSVDQMVLTPVKKKKKTRAHLTVCVCLLITSN